MCHVSGDASVGPALHGVVGKRGRPWLTRWLKEPERMVAEKDPVATDLLAKYGGVLMPNLGLSDADVSALLDFLEAPSKGAQAKAEPKPVSPPGPPKYAGP